MQPLVVTLGLDDGSQQRLEDLRRQHFPPERNVVPAHVSLFHALPGTALPRVLRDVARAAGRPAFALRVTGVRSLGGGTALTVEAPDLSALHTELAGTWADLLTRQDRQPLRAHVTVQNRVTPQQARVLRADLTAGFTPWEATAVGVDVWRYLGGPWEPVTRVPFAPPPTG